MTVAGVTGRAHKICVMPTLRPSSPFASFAS
jgi:hypothetical protein